MLRPRACEQPDAIGENDQHDTSEPLHGRVQCKPKGITPINGSYDLQVPRTNANDFFIAADQTQLGAWH